jgi:peptidoglycan/LPS O-acetylase OafA/YrhL
MSQSNETTPTRVPELDGVRGLAITMVLFCHYIVGQVELPLGSLEAKLMALFRLTWSGVDLFFVLSGYLLGGILIAQRGSSRYFCAFYARRVTRIFPVYYLTLIAFVIVRSLMGDVDNEGARWLFADAFPIWTYALHLQNFWISLTGVHGASWLGVTWSLAVEEQFYLILPLLIRFIPPRLLLPIALALASTAPLLRTWLFYHHPHGGMAGYVLLPCRWDALLIGVAGAVMVRREFFTRWMSAPASSLPLFVAFTTLFAGVAVLLLKAHSIGSLGMAAFGHTWLALLALLIILVAQFGPWAWFRALFRTRWLVWLGGISYGLYLFHQIISGLCHLWLCGAAPRIASWSDAGVTLIALVLSLLIASLSWHCFERPLVRLGRRVSY